MTRHNRLFLTMFLALQAWALPSYALIEGRAFVGLNSVNPGDLNNLTSPAVSLAGLLAYGADVIVSPPMMGVGFGLRYEAAGQKVTAGSAEIDLSASRIAGVVNYRLIDTGIFLGPIATVGLSHSLTMSAKGSSFGTSIEGAKSTSFSIGAEGGITLVGFVLGAEVGYQSWTFDEVKSGGTAIANTKANLGGLYARALVGFGF